MERCEWGVLAMPTAAATESQKPIWDSDSCVEWRDMIFRRQQKTERQWAPSRIAFVSDAIFYLTD